MSTQKLRDIAGKLRSIANEVDDLAEGEEESLAQDALQVMLRSCQEKRSYSTPEAAGQAAADRKSQGETNELRVYLCHFCKGYHLTKRSLEQFDKKNNVK
jgi:hypothetical protein